MDKVSIESVVHLGEYDLDASEPPSVKTVNLNINDPEYGDYRANMGLFVYRCINVIKQGNRSHVLQDVSEDIPGGLENIDTVRKEGISKRQISTLLKNSMGPELARRVAIEHDMLFQDGIYVPEEVLRGVLNANIDDEEGACADCAPFIYAACRLSRKKFL